MDRGLHFIRPANDVTSSTINSKISYKVTENEGQTYAYIIFDIS
jgi:hypothetical protein